MSEYLGELPRGWCLISLCASKFAKIFEWFRILCSVVFGWMLVLLVCALSMMSLVMLVRMVRGWFLERVGIFIIAVAREKTCGVNDVEVIFVTSCQVS